ncbi:uncharacterized protein LOC142973459 [Anticarsia gemmatalis]|uniref:uncharacterized protein LOC142973459 n=1 Tax=Anticarsia gemmatalis TaxID=129554 RepID=UPI003F76DABB
MVVNVIRTIKTEAWCVVVMCVVAVVVVEVSALNGPNVCMVKQKYNITKRVKYRAPMSVRTYVWCFAVPPRCSKWTTEMRDLTRLETEERTAEVAVCCPGYKMRDVSCVPICPNGKTGAGCSEDCPDNKWGPNCINECKRCKNGFCSPITGECDCLDGWQGESCDTSMPPTTTTLSLEELLTTLTTKITTTTPRVTTPSTTTTPKPKPTTPKPITTTVTIPTTRMTTPLTTPMTTVPSTTVTIPTTVATTPTTVATRPSTVLTSPLTTTTIATTKATSPKILTTEKEIEETTPYLTTEVVKLITETNNTTFITTSTLNNINLTTEDVTRRIFIKPVYSNTESIAVKATEPTVVARTLPTVNVQQEPTEIITTTEAPKPTIPQTTTTKEITYKTETTKKETTIRIMPTTVKFKPKEIWIRPAQKGESPIVETKIKMTHEFPRYRSANNKELIPAVTTPKTIIVSIIPTSVSYSTFKKIALTSSYLSTKNTTNVSSYNKTEHGLTTKPMPAVTSKPVIVLTTTKKDVIPTISITNATILPSTSVTPKMSSTKPTSVALEVTKPQINSTNSMTTEINKNISTSASTSPNTVRVTQNVVLMNATTKSLKITTQASTERTTKHFVKAITAKPVNKSSVTKHKPTNPPKIVEKEITKSNTTKVLSKMTTDGPADDEEFHILTEPEHITAVMGDKGTERSSVDLISVISIAGGVMMAVITVAVIIVMIERCKKPRYEDVRKINDIRMQVMIDNNDVPPPYVRSIFHTPLPEPPSSEKCHYQPISTLDRNLKQFMRPVVVQTISPIMLENFRGILECHYDHLPRRSHDFGTIQSRSSVAPSMSDCGELRHMRASVTDSTIEALKCEAKLDVIDNTTSEPLYAEIPCWRPPSEHAIEIINLNGEAVTEL